MYNNSSIYSDPYGKLLKALIDGNYATLQSVLNPSIDINRIARERISLHSVNRDFQQITIINPSFFFIAVTAKHTVAKTEIIKLLLKNNANINSICSCLVTTAIGFNGACSRATVANLKVNTQRYNYQPYDIVHDKTVKSLLKLAEFEQLVVKLEFTEVAKDVVLQAFILDENEARCYLQKLTNSLNNNAAFDGLQTIIQPNSEIHAYWYTNLEFNNYITENFLINKKSTNSCAIL